MNTNYVTYPCRGCVYFNTCGDGARTEFCAGRMTKSKQKQKQEDLNPDIIYLEWNASRTDFNLWNADRIKNAFNNGNGTMWNFREYMRDNPRVYFERICKSELLELQEKHGNAWRSFLYE